MADVRAMLRAERAARAPPKENRHIVPADISNGRKRKALDELADDGSKRARADATLSAEPSENAIRTTHMPEEPEQTEEAASIVIDVVKQDQGNVDEDEWAAFEREVARSPRPETANSAPKPSALGAAATISAAPLTAAELAARDAEDKNTQRTRRDEELEAEKEDATRQLEDEFEEMEALESRLRALREKREALRRGNALPETVDTELEMTGESNGGHQPEEGSDEEDEDEDEEWDDGWTFRPA